MRCSEVYLAVPLCPRECCYSVKQHFHPNKKWCVRGAVKESRYTRVRTARGIPRHAAGLPIPRSPVPLQRMSRSDARCTQYQHAVSAVTNAGSRRGVSVLFQKRYPMRKTASERKHLPNARNREIARPVRRNHDISTRNENRIPGKCHHRQKINRSGRG